MLKKIRELFKVRSVVFKTFWSTIAIVTLPLVLLVMLNYYRSVAQSRENALASSLNAYEQAHSFIEYKVESIKNIVNLISNDETIQNVANLHSNYIRQNIGNWVIQMKQVKTIAYATYKSPDINNINLYLYNSPLFVGDSRDAIGLLPESNSWYPKLSFYDQNYQWVIPTVIATDEEDRTILFIRKIFSSQRLNKELGIIKADIPVHVIDDILKQAFPGNSESLILFNKNNEIIASQGDEVFTDLKLLKDLVEDSTPYEGGFSKIVYQKKNYFIRQSEIEQTDWMLAAVISNDGIVAQTANATNSMLLMIFVSVTVMVPISYFMSLSNTRQIRSIISYLRKVAHGDFSVEVMKSSEDEMGELTRNINYLLTKMSMLVDEKYKLGIEIKQFELAALQSQINPHFLYNTLDMLHWMALNRGAKDIDTTVEALARFYRLSLGKGEDVVTLAHELEHVSNYVLIQNMRFNGAIDFILSVEEGFLQLNIVKLTLQPIVENAILHGIMERDEAAGTVSIGAQRQGRDVLIKIQDDGIGIGKDKIKGLIAEDEPTEELEKAEQGKQRQGGYGMKNINRRLKLRFGSAYGLDIESTPGAGTTVILRIPGIVPEEV